jgi:hypothetical protein
LTESPGQPELPRPKDFEPVQSLLSAIEKKKSEKNNKEQEADVGSSSIADGIKVWIFIPLRLIVSEFELRGG